MCPLSGVVLFGLVFLDKVVKLVGGGSVINGATLSSLEGEEKPLLTYIQGASKKQPLNL